MKRLVFILLLTLVAGFIVWPQKPGNYIPGGDVLPGNPGIHLGSFARQGAKLGLDLQGGTQLTLQADMTNVPDDQKDTAMQGVINVIQRRVNAYGVAEAEIQTLGSDRVIVQLPGVKDIEEAKKLIGQTAKHQQVTNPKNTIFSIKRFMGRRHSEVAQEEKMVPYEIVGGAEEYVKVRVRGKEYTPGADLQLHSSGPEEDG